MNPVIVLTRFNIASRYRYPKLYQNIENGHYVWLDEDYLDKRFELFETYALPSFLAQTDQDFRWIVMFHKDTPQKYMPRIESYKEKCPIFEPWFLDDEESDKFSDIITDRIRADYPDTGVVTIRIDNDDAIHSTFVAEMRKAAEGCESTSIFAFANGLQYDTRNMRLAKYNLVNNHFIGFYAPAGAEVMHPLAFAHPDVDKIVKPQDKYTIKTDIPLWVEIISDTNCTNELWYRPSKVLVSYRMKSEYKVLKLKWNTPLQWFIGTYLYLPVACVRMGLDILKLIKMKLIKK